MLHSLFLALVLQTAGQVAVETHLAYPAVANVSFLPGEQIEYKLNFGILPVGKAQIRIFENIHRVNYRSCYKIEVYAKTVGAIDLVAKVEDTWGVYLDSVSLVPHIGYLRLVEGNFRKHEIVRFDHFSNMAEVKRMDQRRGVFKEPEYFQVPDQVMDLVSGLMRLRNFNYDTLQIGDTVVTEAFFDKTHYEFEVILDGIETIKVKLGTFEAYRLVPVMPNNSVFDGENSITLWVATEPHHLPLRMEGDMFIGAASCELISAEGLKYPLHSPKPSRDSSPQ